MADVHTKEVRSLNMSRIRSKDTKPELIVRKALFANGFRFRLHVKNLPGKPDVVLKKYNTVIFVHGCFWHGHKNCNSYVVPKTNTAWWLGKITGNQKNDEIKKKKLLDAGWRIIEVFECELRKNKLQETLRIMVARIKSLSL